MEIISFPYKKLLLSLSTLLIFGHDCFCENRTEPNKEKPNVILILADDMALGDLSYVNGGVTRTPNLDKLASESVWFNQGYSAAPVCAPARASLLTGLSPHQTGCVTLNMQRFPELTRINKNLPTIADVFSDNEYITGLIGKWHCGEGDGYHPMDRGFKEFEGFLGYMVNSYFDYELDINREIYDFNEKYLTDDLSERAIKFIRRHKNEPFFLHLAHYAPHRPLDAPKESIDFYLNKGFDKNTSIIYAMIEIMDKGIGELIEELNRLEIREKTLIIFSSDNGPDPLPGARNNQGLRGTKYTIYEGGIHVPFFINWKDSFMPKENNEIVHFTDIFPTLVDICELELSRPINFVGGSLSEILYSGNDVNLPEHRFWQWNRGTPDYSHNAAVRQGKWKLVRPYQTRNIPEGPSMENSLLFNLENDPHEENNVSKQNQEIFQNLNVLLEEWSKSVEFLRLKNKD
jgi:arylsulfatase A-like enzyme